MAACPRQSAHRENVVFHTTLMIITVIRGVVTRKPQLGTVDQPIFRKTVLNITDLLIQKPIH